MKTPFAVKVTGFGAITARGDWSFNAPPAPRDGEGFAIEDFRLENYLATPKTYLDRASALALAGCALSLRDAGLEGPFGEDFGITLGTKFGCVETMRGFEAKLAESGPRAVSPLLFSHSYFNSPISLCAIEWGLKGTHGTFCGANAGLDAVFAAQDAIALGHAKTMLCGGVEALSPARKLAGEGENSGEASVFLVLERADADGQGRSFEEFFGENSAANSLLAQFGDCGALNGLLAVLRELAPIDTRS